MDQFNCPKCDKIHSISEIELYELYNDGKETEFKCKSCNVEFTITSTAIKWQFDTELND